MNQKQNTRSEVVLLAASGTGGHLFPASALARRMKEKGHEVHLATDARGLAYLPQLEEMPVHKLAAATIFGGKMASPMELIENYLSLSFRRFISC